MFLLIRTGPEGVQIAQTTRAKVPDGFVGPGQSAFVVVALDFQLGPDQPQHHQISPSEPKAY